MATKKRTTGKAKATYKGVLTLADTYGLGLIAFDPWGADQSEILAYLSPSARRLAKTVNNQNSSTKKKAISKRRAAFKR